MWVAVLIGVCFFISGELEEAERKRNPFKYGPPKKDNSGLFLAGLLGFTHGFLKGVKKKKR